MSELEACIKAEHNIWFALADKQYLPPEVRLLLKEAHTLLTKHIEDESKKAQEEVSNL